MIGRVIIIPTIEHSGQEVAEIVKLKALARPN